MGSAKTDLDIIYKYGLNLHFLIQATSGSFQYLRD